MEFIALIIIFVVGWLFYAKKKSRDFSTKLTEKLVKKGMSPQLADDYYSANHDRIHHMYFKQKFDVTYIAGSIAEGWDGVDRYRPDAIAGSGREGVVSLFSPNRDYINQNFTVSWNHKTGSHIEKGDVIYQLKGETQTLSTTADKECQIILKECKNGYEVKRSGMLLGKIDDSKPVTNTGTDELPTHNSSALARTKKLDSGQEVQDLEKRLLELQRLHKKGLISKEAYSRKEQEILNDL